MATYKVIQDIEAEDKLVGPLSLRQFIYAGVSAVCLYICFLAFTKNAVFLVGFFLPIAIIGAFFAFPWKGEQPTEIWALARLRFTIKPRVRVWNQSGMKDLVTITAPRKVETHRPRTKNLSENEVHSRLKALADTVDSRGWATRNAAYSRYGHGASFGLNNAIAGTGHLGNLQPGAVPSEAFAPANDIFDDQNSVAQNFEAMLSRSSQNQRQRVLQQMQQPASPAQPNRQYQPPAPMAAAQYGPQLPAPVMPAAMMPSANPSPMTAMPVPATTGRPGQTQPYAGQGAAPAANNAWFMSNPSYPPSMAGASNTPPATQNRAPAMPMMPMPAAPAPPQSQQNVFILPGEIPIQTGPLPMPMAAAPSAADQQASQQIRDNMPPAPSINYGHMKVLQPVGPDGNPVADPAAAPAPASEIGTPAYASMGAPVGAAGAAPEPVTRKPDPAILELANNDDLDIATIARQANKEIRKSPDEVEIRLH